MLKQDSTSDVRPRFLEVAGHFTNQLSKDCRAVMSATDSLGASRRASMRARAGQVGVASEPLACPRCKDQFDFGDFCPRCDVCLVGASAADLVEPEDAPDVQASARQRRIQYVTLGFLLMELALILASYQLS